MALTMLDKQPDKSEQSAWPADIAAEFEREKQEPQSLRRQRAGSESERVRVWTIRLKPGERIGFHRHVLDYFWTSVTGGRGRQHVHDGTTVEYTYAPGETRHETYGAGEFKVHDLENLGDKEMVFMTIEFLQSANKPMALPETVRRRPRHNAASPLAVLPGLIGNPSAWQLIPRTRMQRGSSLRMTILRTAYRSSAGGVIADSASGPDCLGPH